MTTEEIVTSAAPAGKTAAGCATRAPFSTVAVYAAWSWKRIAAFSTAAPSRGIMPAMPVASASATRTAAGTSIDIGVRCLPLSVSPVSSLASAAMPGSS
ncbi:MAG TPA: hypothetical protein VFE59_00715, partial [Trebonia sp.]|nr:hypothetical protein [Trebonia sp.]